MFRPPLALALTLLLGTSAIAQQAAPVAPPPLPATAPPAAPSQELVVDVTGGISAPMPIAIPAMATPAVVNTAAKPTDVMGRELAQIVTNDLKNSGLFNPLPPAQLRTVMFPEVTAPAFDYWGGSGAQALVQGFVRANGDGTLTVGCYLYDVSARTELARQGFVVSPGDWRRAAHKCADTVYARLTGEGPYFDSRIVYVSETGPKGRRIKRLAIMDQDGANHRFLTNGQSIVLTPRFAPNQQSIVYMSYLNDKPSIYVYDIGSGRQRLVVSNVSLAFAPRFSPDGRSILFSMAQSGNTDLYRVAADQFARHRHRRQLFARRPPHRVRKRSFGRAAALCDERRRFKPAAHQLRWRTLRHAGVEPARRPDRLHQTRRRVPHRRNERERRRREIADQQLAGRGAELVAQWPRHHLPALDARRVGAGQQRQGRPVVGRFDRGQRTQDPDSARWLRPGMGTASAVSLLLGAVTGTISHSRRPIMARFTTTLLLATALVTTAACSKKRPEVLPPAPGEAPVDPNAGTGTGPVTGAAVPGSAEDFKRSITSDTVNFGLDMYDIDGTARGILDSQSDWLQRYPNVRITVEGHADERGTREYNLALGDRRANSAKNYLVSRGVSAARITTISYGKERPAALGSDEASWAQNRRAVTVVLN
jgi:peptidoglycan-associated lipoprotein